MTSILTDLVIFLYAKKHKTLAASIQNLSYYMAFVRKQGKTKIMWLGVTTSTAIAKSALVAWSSGLLIAATSSTAPSLIAGVLAKAIAATDSDYATARLVPVEVPIELGVVWLADVTATAVAADQGLFCDLTDASTVNRGASTYDIFQVQHFLTTTKCDGFLNIGTFGCGVIGA